MKCWPTLKAIEISFNTFAHTNLSNYSVMEWCFLTRTLLNLLWQSSLIKEHCRIVVAGSQNPAPALPMLALWLCQSECVSLESSCLALFKPWCQCSASQNKTTEQARV